MSYKSFTMLLLFTLCMIFHSCGSKKKIVDKVEVKEEKEIVTKLSKTDSIKMIEWFKNYLSELEIEPINEADSTHVLIETPQGNFKVTSKNAKVNISNKKEEGVKETTQEIKTDSVSSTEEKKQVKTIQKDIEKDDSKSLMWAFLITVVVAGFLIYWSFKK